METDHPLSQTEIEQQLDLILQTEFSFLRTDKLAVPMVTLSRGDQGFMLDWTARVASTNVQLAFRFTQNALGIIERTEPHVIESWALHVMDTYDRVGLRPAMVVIEGLEHFLEHTHARTAGAVFEEEQGVLLHFVQGLSGRPLKLAEAEEPYTDTETLYMPPLIARLPDKEDNFRLYKVTAAYLWAQIRFGTFRLPLEESASQFEYPEHFLAIFHALETIRLEACLGRELPGLVREMHRLGSLLDENPGNVWADYRTRLEQRGASATDTFECAQLAYADNKTVQLDSRYGVLRPQAVTACMAKRVAKEKTLLRIKLACILDELERKSGTHAEADQRFEAHVKGETEGMPVYELTFDGLPVSPPETVQQLISSIQLDFGDIPPEYLVPAGPGEYDPSLYTAGEPGTDNVWSGTYHEEGATLYPEWDFKRQAYRKNWCAVREKEIAPAKEHFVEQTLEKYATLVRYLRKTFEGMRDEDRLLKRQSDGDDIDIDALIGALAEAHDGRELSSQIFTRWHRSERDIAVMFMVDMSGSTRGWINKVERESLILLCEALESLGDRYAIYGFSGMSRKRCEIFHIKSFDDTCHAEVKARIAGIKPQDYTRMGFAIRHLSAILNAVEARTRILITLSDGKPDDFTDYRGDYGIEDTRRALLEAKRSGIHPYCITIDEQAHAYLPHMYGPAAYTLVDNVAQLPFKVSDIYRRLTT